MPMPSDFDRESMYTRDAWFLDHVDFFPDEGRLVATCDTNRLGPLVEAQRPWPNHPKHLPGAVMIQITGTIGQLFATYVLEMPATEGWVGFGTHIHSARFRRVGEIGRPVLCAATLLSKRNVRGTVFTKFAFEFTQDGEVVYESEQTAAWVRSAHRGPCPDTDEAPA